MKKAERWYAVVGIIMLAAILAVNAWMTSKFYFNFITSDDGSELVFSRMLAAEGGILSKNWYYSTELEILNMPLVYSFLFRFTSDFKLVRILGQVILSGILLASYYFCLYSIDKHLAAVRFCKTAFLLLVPISDAWVFLSMKTYYVPHVAVSFVALGLACQIQKENISIKKKAIVLAAGMLLAFVGCLEGMRHIQMAHLPLLLSSLWVLWNCLERHGWDWRKIRFPVGVAANVIWLLSAGAGVAVNKFVLSPMYNVRSYYNEKFTETVGFENIETVWNTFLETTGYGGEQSLLSVGGVCNALAVVSAVALLCLLLYVVRNIAKFPSEEQLVWGFLVLSFGFCIFICTVLHYGQSRYIMACVAPMILFLILLEKQPVIKQYLLLSGICCVILIFGYKEYRNIQASTANEELRNVYNYIVENDCTYGYSTFWAGNLLTELTNGRFESRNVRGDYENGKLILWPWLTPVNVEYRDEPVIAVIQKRRVEDLPLPENWSLLMEDEAYAVYKVPDHREMEEYLNRRQ